MVKWVGYNDATWEPLANLRGSSNELLREYHSANGLRIYRWMEQGCGKKVGGKTECGLGCDRCGAVDGSDFLVLFVLLCYFCCFVFTKGLDFAVDGAGFIRRGVVVGGGFRSLWALRTLRPAGCLEFG